MIDPLISTDDCFSPLIVIYICYSNFNKIAIMNWFCFLNISLLVPDPNPGAKFNADPDAQLPWFSQIRYLSIGNL